jgi:DNA anti-recombination protein RmuC
LTQVQREFLGELTAVTGQIKQQSLQMEARAAAHEKRVAEEFVETMNRLRSELVSSVNESARTASEYTKNISQGLAEHAGKLEQKASSEFGTLMVKMREDLTAPLSESAKTTSDYVKALTAAVEGLNRVLVNLGERQVVIQQVKKKGWFGR